MSDFIIDITTPPESAMAVDITVSENPLAIETIGMASSFSVDVLPTEPMVIDFVAGSIKGDKGEPGGYTITKIANGSLAGHRVVVLNSDNTVSYASSDNADNADNVLGITAHAATSGAEIVIQLRDIMEEATWDWTPQNPVFLGLDGLLTQNEEMVGLFTLIMGTALTSTKILINKQVPFFG